MKPLNLKRFTASIKDLRSTIDDYLKNKVNGEELYKKAETKADKNVQAEDEFRDDFCNYLRGKGYRIKKEAKADAEKESGKDYRLIDLMVKGEEDALVPIQLKFNEESKIEIQEDIDIIEHCVNKYKNIKKGYMILLTNVENSNFERHLKETNFVPYRYALWVKLKRTK